jgi:hypothetical protein
MTDLSLPNQDISKALQVLLDRPISELVSENVSAFAYDLAYGWAHGLWTHELSFNYATDIVTEQLVPRFRDKNLELLYKQKWYDKTPNARLLCVWGYLDEVKPDRHVITEKALALLEKPVVAPIVFISYKRDKSSAFAVAVEARLKLIDSAIGVFVDKDIKAGEVWHAELEDQVKEASIFICLIAPGTLEAEYVQKEINWAMSDLSRKIIPVCHAGFDPNTLPDHLKARQYVAVQDEKARSYDIAINDIIHALGYSTV